jgi:hypothetical protein
MKFTGRSRELGALRQLLDRPEPQLVRVTGLPGVGKSALVRRAAADYAGLAVTCPPLPDPAQRSSMADALRRHSIEVSGSDPQPAWRPLLEAVARAAGQASRPWVLVLDDAHRLGEARARLEEPLMAILRDAASKRTPLHVVLVGRESGVPGFTRREEERAEPSFPEPRPTTLNITPLPLRAAAPHLPGRSASARIRAYAVFGGIPGVLAHLDTKVTVGTNVRRLLLDPSGPLADAPLAWMEREVQTPSRYVAILRALSHGPADWGAVHGGVPGLTRSGQAAPYLKRLGELGLVETSVSLDAGPRSRSRRYTLTDPFPAFWLRFVLPWRVSEEANRDEPPLREHYARAIRARLDDHVESVLPVIARQHMEFDAIETLGSNARVNGALWGPGVDIPVAGILTSGAPYYGVCSWKPPIRPASPLDRLDAQIRETRHGFGRERRLRLVFTGRTTPTWLRRAVARRPEADLIDADDLVGA